LKLDGDENWDNVEHGLVGATLDLHPVLTPCARLEYAELPELTPETVPDGLAQNAIHHPITLVSCCFFSVFMASYVRQKLIFHFDCRKTTNSTAFTSGVALLSALTTMQC
jgi:hypothetical protein